MDQTSEVPETPQPPRVLIRTALRLTCGLAMLVGLVVVRVANPIFAISALALAFFLMWAAFRPGGRALGHVSAAIMLIGWASAMNPSMLLVIVPAALGLGSVLVHLGDDEQVLRDRYG